VLEREQISPGKRRSMRSRLILNAGRRRVQLWQLFLLGLLGLASISVNAASAAIETTGLSEFSNTAKGPITLVDAMQLAQQNYPAIKAARYREESAKSGVDKEKTLYLPRGSVLIQESRATSNNLTGPLLPQLTIPQIAGAVQGGNDLTGGWGSAAGTLISWEPFDFGFRKASVEAAKAQERLAHARVALTELEVVSAAADIFLRASASKQVLRAARSKLDRMRIFRESVSVLVDKQLRSKTDYFLAEAEEAKAKDQVIEAEQSLELALISLAESMGVSDVQVVIDDRALAASAPREITIARSADSHPLLISQAATIKLSEARTRVINKTYYPKFSLIGALYGRGSGFRTDVSIDQSKGYYPTTFNYAIGLNVYFPFLDIFELRARRNMELKTTLAERSQFELTSLKLRCEDERAKALMKGALRILENAPVKVRAAREAVNSVKVRYQLGLASVNDVAQDEQLFTESEVEEATARLRVWRALLAEAAAKGDMTQFRRAAELASRE
jgi:outer membrane protein